MVIIDIDTIIMLDYNDAICDVRRRYVDIERVAHEFDDCASDLESSSDIGRPRIYDQYMSL